MADDVIGTSRVNFTVDTSQFSAAINSAKNLISGMSADAQRQYQSLNAAEQKRVLTLLKQAETLGMTRKQQIAFNATLQKVPTSILDDLQKKLAASGREANSATEAVSRMNQAFKAMAAGVVGFAVVSTFKKFITETQNAENEQAQLAAVLKSTGNAAGWTQQQLNAMATAYSAIGGKSIFSEGEITKAQTNLLEFTNVVGNQLPKALQAAIDMATRKNMDLASATELVGRAIDIPSKGLATLTRQGFKFDESVEKQVKSLEKMGKLAEAQDIILKAIETSYGGAGQAARDQFGGGLKAVKDAINNLFTGKGGTLDGLNNELNSLATTLSSEEMKQAFASVASSIVWLTEKAASAINMIAGLNAMFEETLRIAGSEDFKSKDPLQNMRDDLIRIDRGIEANRRSLAEAEESGRENQIAFFENAIANQEASRKALAEKAASYISPKDVVDNAVKKINDKLLEILPPPKAEGNNNNQDINTGGGSTLNAGRRMLDQLSQRTAEINAQLLSDNSKLLASEKELVRFNQQIADIKAQKIQTADQKSLLSNEDAIRAALEQNVALEKSLELKKEQVKLTEEAAKAWDTFNTKSSAVLLQGYSKRLQQNEQYKSILNTMGMGTEATSRALSQEHVYKQYRDLFDNLADSAENAKKAAERAGTPFDNEAYERARELLNNQLNLQLIDLDNYYKAVDAKRADWKLGFTEGLANYKDEANNVMKGMSDSVKNALDGATNSLTDFVVKGKTSFKDLADSVINDLVRIGIQRSVSGLADMLGGRISSLFSGVFNNATGGVYGGAGISKYKNQIISQTTLFPFAKGGIPGFNIGAVGEVPGKKEGIFPITRIGGDLGVRALMPETQGVNQNNITIQINAEGGTQTSTSGGIDPQFYQALGKEISNLVDQRIAQQWRQGGIAWNKLNGR